MLLHFFGGCRKNIVKNYGVIECDPIVLAGLDRTVSFRFLLYIFISFLFLTYISRCPLNLVMIFFLAT